MKVARGFRKYCFIKDLVLLRFVLKRIHCTNFGKWFNGSKYRKNPKLIFLEKNAFTRYLTFGFIASYILGFKSEIGKSL